LQLSCELNKSGGPNERKHVSERGGCDEDSLPANPPAHHGFWLEPLRCLRLLQVPRWEEELPLPFPLFTTQVTKWLRLCKLHSRPGIPPRNVLAAGADPRALL